MFFVTHSLRSNRLFKPISLLQQLTNMFNKCQLLSVIILTYFLWFLCEMYACVCMFLCECVGMRCTFSEFPCSNFYLSNPD